jgi:hypothetical protein
MDIADVIYWLIVNWFIWLPVVIVFIVLISILVRKTRHNKIDSLKEKYNLTDEQVQAVKKKKIWVGMPVELMYLSWGRFCQENRTGTENGVDIQHIYGKDQYTKYVYTENGFVKSWQT